MATNNKPKMIENNAEVVQTAEIIAAKATSMLDNSLLSVANPNLNQSTANLHESTTNYGLPIIGVTVHATDRIKSKVVNFYTVSNHSTV